MRNQIYQLIINEEQRALIEKALEALMVIDRADAISEGKAGEYCEPRHLFTLADLPAAELAMPGCLHYLA
ncbi:MAG: hypothetical protein WAV48_06695 [Candidatus Magasanikiibacteriota bacterium]